MDEINNNYHPSTLVHTLRYRKKSYQTSLYNFLRNTIFLTIFNLDSRNIINKQCNRLSEDSVIENLNKISTCILLDLSEPFYCTKHKILLDKLYQYKLSTSYPINMTQKVQITHKEDKCLKDYLLNRMPVKCGAPQQSVLSPLHFPKLKDLRYLCKQMIPQF